MFATTDLTVGNPVRQIILFSLPMFIGGLIQQLYVAVDMVIVGRYCGPITRLFLGSPPETVTNYVFRYLLVTTPFYIALSTILVYRNALQGLDYQFVPFAGGVLELIGRGAFAFPLLAWFGYEGVAATNILAWVPAALLDYLYYRKKVR